MKDTMGSNQENLETDAGSVRNAANAASVGGTTALRRTLAILDNFGPLLALAVVAIGFALADQTWGQGKFVELRNLRVILVMTAPVAVAALGMTLVIITGGIDLSAGTASMLCATVLACVINAGWSIWVAVGLSLIHI